MRTFEIRPSIEGGYIKSVRMEDPDSSCNPCGGGGGKKAKAMFTHGYHTYFAFCTLELSDDLDTWVQ